MKKTESLPELLKSASESVKRTAQRNGVPIAISEDGQVKIINPPKKIKRVNKKSHHRKKV
jgi:hypothetical protein